MATQVYKEYRRGLRTQPCGAPVLRMIVEEVLLPILTVSQEVQDPVAEGGAEAQATEFGDEFRGNNSVEG